MANCVDCTTPESIPQTEILYAKGEPSPKSVRRHTRIAEPETGYALYHCDENYQTGFYLIVPHEANNLVPNPTFMLDLDGWSNFNSVIGRSNNTSFDSGFSLKINGSEDFITAERREYAEIAITEFLAGQNYTFSMYLFMPTLWDVSDPYMGTISIADDLGNEIFSERIDVIGQWQRLEISTVIDNNATELYLRVNLRSQDQRENQPPYNLTGDFNLGNEYLYADMAQFELGTEASTPFHGDTGTYAPCNTDCGGYSWWGVSHKSASTRNACARDGGKLICLSDLGLEITSHSGHSAPPIRDVSFPLNNRPGEFYQKSVADARIITLVGQMCEATLKDLECTIYGLAQNVLPDLNPCSCCGQFLLVYRHQDCDLNACNAERDFAICVTYIGGLEGNRTGLYHQQVALQFKAHSPFFFEWPGHSSAPLNYTQVVTSPNLVQITADGVARGFPISNLNTYSTVACRTAVNSVAIGGTFDSIDGSDDQCSANVAIWNCDEWLDTCLGFIGGGVNQMVSDAQGNVLVAGSFSTPCNNIGIIYEDGNIGCFPGYTGGEAFSIAAPFWAQVAVGSASGLYILDNDGNWSNYAIGQIEAITVDNAGNIYAVGQNGAYFLDVNATGCLDPDNAVLSSIGYTFNGTVNSVDINLDTGQVYLGGAFTEATPDPIDTCQVTNGARIDSNGSNQQIQFRQIAGNNYQVELYYTNVISRNTASDCITGNNYLRVTGQSSVGTSYNLLLGRHNTTVNSLNTVIVGTDTFYTIILDVDVGQTIGDPCETLDDGSLINELDITTTTIVSFAPLPLPGGTGIDNTLSKLSAQCVFVEEQYQGDTVTLNYVAQLNSSGTLLPMGSGLPSEVNVIAVNPVTDEVFAGTTQGLYIFNGQSWSIFPGLFSGSTSTEILDVKFCADGSMLVLYDGIRGSVLPGNSEVSYLGDAPPQTLDLLVQGPGIVETFEHNNTDNGLRLCTHLECNEIARLNFVNGKYTSNFRNNLSPSVLGGSRYDICLHNCMVNDMGLYISEDDAQTKAVLLWRESFHGIESLCCKTASSSLQLTASQARTLYDERCIDTRYLQFHRDPTNEDCSDQGIRQGTVWHNAASGCGLFIYTGDDCEPCPEYEDAYIGSEGAPITLPDGTNLCPEDLDCGDI